MNIGLLGVVTVTVEGHCRRIRSGKVRALLATLALEAGHPISCADLSEELWPGESLGNARNALQANVSRLRRVLDAPGATLGTPRVLRAVPNGYLLDVDATTVDSARFLSLAARGAAELRQDPIVALGLFEAALRLWRGPALLDAGDGLRCRSAAALLEESRLTVRENLTGARIALGDERCAVAELRQLVGQHALREHLYELLMLGLYRIGRQCEALELFHQVRRRLDEELGLQPGVSLRRRHAEILAQDPALMAPSAVWPARP